MRNKTEMREFFHHFSVRLLESVEEFVTFFDALMRIFSDLQASNAVSMCSSVGFAISSEDMKRLRLISSLVSDISFRFISNIFPLADLSFFLC